jgi:hypothetical protein
MTTKRTAWLLSFRAEAVEHEAAWITAASVQLTQRMHEHCVSICFMTTKHTAWLLSCRAEAAEREAGEAASRLLSMRQQLAATTDQYAVLLEAQAGQQAETHKLEVGC